MGICDGRVVVVSGAGRGIGREHALAFAREGAKVVVNDLGAEIDGSGSSTGPAGEVVDEVRAMGGEAVANGDDVSDYEGAGRMIQTAIDTFGTIDVLVNNAGHPARPHARQHDHRRVGRGDPGAPARHVRTDAPRRRVLAQPYQGRRDERRPHHQHDIAFGDLRQRRPDQLRGGQGRASPPSRSSRPRSWGATASP